MNTKQIAILAAIVALAAVVVVAVPSEDVSAEDVAIVDVDTQVAQGMTLLTVEFNQDITGNPAITLNGNNAGNLMMNGASGTTVLQYAIADGDYTLVAATTLGTASIDFSVKDGAVVEGGEGPGPEPEPGASLTSITIGAPSKTIYKVGETLDLTGMTVTANYDDESSVAVTDYTVSPANGTVLDAAGTVTVTVTYQDKTAKFAVTVEADDTPVQPEQPVDPSQMQEMYVNGIYSSKDTTFNEYQIVIVNGTLTIASGADITIMGQLVVPEGSSIVIEPGATLTLTNPSEDIVVADVEGTITIDQDDIDGAGLMSITAGNVSVSGEILVRGNIDAGDATLTVETDGVVTVEETGIVQGEDIAVYGDLTVYGKIGAIPNKDGTIPAFDSVINNYGTVTYNSAVAATGTMTVNMLQSGAVLDIQRYTSNGASMTVTDENLVFRAAYGENPEVNVGNSSAPNTITLTVTGQGDQVVGEFTGLMITENVTQKVSNGDVSYTNTMDVAGTLAVNMVYNGDELVTENMSANATIVLNGQKAIAVTGEMILGSNVIVNNNGVLNVSGSVTATAGTLNNNGTITVEGDGIITAKAAINYETPSGDRNTVINATKYTTVQGTNTVTVYVTIDTALATVNQDGNTITQLVLLGENTVTQSAVLPAGVTMNTVGATLVIGQKNGSDVVLTIAEGASVRGAADLIQVNGTLYAENKRNINSASVDAIVSDVYSEEVDENGKAVRDGWARWTNIYTAMAEASEGDVVQVYKGAADGYVELGSNLTIPAGVTLVVADGKAPLLLKNGVTLTVNGTLQTSMEVYAENMFGVTAMNVANETAKQSSAIVVNGYLYMAAAVGSLDYAAVGATGEYAALTKGAPIAGAYYSYTASNVVWNAVSPLANAVANAAAVNGEITVCGPVTAGDITFTAGELCDTIVVADRTVQDMNGNDVVTSLTVGSLTLVGTTLQADAGVSGSVVVGEAVVDLQAIADVVVADDEGMVVTGAAVNGLTDRAGITVSAGTVTFGAANANAVVAASAPVTVAEGATMVSVGAEVATVTVDGTLEVADNSSVTATKMTVNGTANIGSNETADIATLVVYGEFNVAVATDTANPGIASADRLDVGIDEDAIDDGVDGTTGTVNGLVSAVTANISAQATLSEATQAALDAKVSTAFEVEGAVWFTNYAALDEQVLIPGKAPVQNAYLAGWQDEDGNDVKVPYYARADAVLTASINYDVYHIYVLANEAVDDVFIDGNLMQYGIILTEGPVQYYGYYTVVSAGSHTISCTLANGYSGNGVLSVNGTQMSGMTFTTEGTPATAAGIDYNLQLSGFEKSGYVPDSPDTPSDSGDDGLSITDILLIVLVILIIVMAIIVAVRLMRS